MVGERKEVEGWRNWRGRLGCKVMPRRVAYSFHLVVKNGLRDNGSEIGRSAYDQYVMHQAGDTLTNVKS